MLKAGIDFSMSSPAITVGKSLNYTQDCKSFYYTDKKSLEGKFGTNIYGMMTLPYEHQMERFHNITEWALSILKQFKVVDVCLEGYSMGSKGTVFNIGENTGILKHTMWINNISFITPAPTQVKKYFTGKGNANKEVMYDSFYDQTNVDLLSIFNKTSKTSNPISDIVDSYAMLSYGINGNK